MKVLIVGAKGMLGQELVRVFTIDSYYRVTAWDREELDVTDPTAVAKRIPQASPSLVINVVAYNDVNGAETDQPAANILNGKAVGYLARACAKLDVPLIHFSTDYVFDGKQEEGYKEDDEPRPISAYGQSKFLGEQELAAHTNKFWLIRLSRLFGKQGRGKKSAIEGMIERARSTGVIRAPNIELSCLTYAPDLARATLKIFENKAPYGIYHRTNLGAVTWLGIAKGLVDAGVRAEVVEASPDEFKRAARVPAYSVLLNTKLPPMRPWQDALREFLQTERK